jgi:hypothetical protein
MSKALVVNVMRKLKQLACAVVPDELAVKTLTLEVRYKHIPEQLGCSSKDGTPKETCFKLTSNTSVCVVSKE